MKNLDSNLIILSFEVKKIIRRLVRCTAIKCLIFFESFPGDICQHFQNFAILLKINLIVVVTFQLLSDYYRTKLKELFVLYDY